jgi:hypothetical protein
MSRLNLNEPTGRLPISGPAPSRVEYPYGRPGDSFRNHAVRGKATCVAYHVGVDPNELGCVRKGNDYRYGTDDPRHAEMVADMRANGFRGGNGQRLHVWVTKDDIYMAEGNHRLRAAIEAGVLVDVEIRYYARVDEEFLLIPFDLENAKFRVVSD